jgi:hypothetical protein
MNHGSISSSRGAISKRNGGHDQKASQTNFQQNSDGLNRHYIKL